MDKENKGAKYTWRQTIVQIIASGFITILSFMLLHDKIINASWTLILFLLSLLSMITITVQNMYSYALYESIGKFYPTIYGINVMNNLGILSTGSLIISYSLLIYITFNKYEKQVNFKTKIVYYFCQSMFLFFCLLGILIFRAAKISK